MWFPPKMETWVKNIRSNKLATKVPPLLLCIMVKQGKYWLNQVNMSPVCFNNTRLLPTLNHELLFVSRNVGIVPAWMIILCGSKQQKYSQDRRSKFLNNLWIVLSWQLNYFSNVGFQFPIIMGSRFQLKIEFLHEEKLLTWWIRNQQGNNIGSLLVVIAQKKNKTLKCIYKFKCKY